MPIRDPEKRKKYNHDWYARNREYRKCYERNLRKGNPARFKAKKRREFEAMTARGIDNRRNSSMYRQVVTVELLRRDGFDCQICNLPLQGKIHVDHIMPVRQGGPDTLENLRLSHDSCNYARNRRIA